VALVGRGPHLEVIRRDGLSLDESGRPVRLAAFPTVSEALAATGAPSVVILTVKAYDVDSAAQDLAAALARRHFGQDDAAGRQPQPDPLLLCLENGLGSEEIVARYFPDAEILAGAITLSVERPAPGHLRLLTDHGGITIGLFQAATGVGPSSVATTRPASPRVAAAPSPAALGLVQALTLAGFRVRVYRHGHAVKWSKVLLNLWANATSAVFDLPPSSLVADPVLFRLDWLAFREALRTMKASGIAPVDLPGYPVRVLASLGRLLPESAFRRLLGRKVAGGRGGKMPSLWLDLQARRGRSEVGFLNGAVATAAHDLGLAAPVNRALTQALEILARQTLENPQVVNCRQPSTSS
jgi:2-dehydropantoate 2-reductase